MKRKKVGEKKVREAVARSRRRQQVKRCPTCEFVASLPAHLGVICLTHNKVKLGG